MSATLALTTFARDDLAEARVWYEQERPGLGAEFAADFYNALHAIEAAPTAQTPAVAHRQRSPEFILAQLNRRLP